MSWFLRANGQFFSWIYSGCLSQCALSLYCHQNTPHAMSSATEGQENRSWWSSFWSDVSFVLICSAGLPHRKHYAQRSLVLGIAVSPWSLRESDCWRCKSRLATPWFAPSSDLSRDLLLFSLSTQCLVGTRIAVRARCMGKARLLLQGGSMVVDTDSLAIFNYFFLSSSSRNYCRKR